MNRVVFAVLTLFLFLMFPFTFGTNLNAEMISIDFEDLSFGDEVYDQYIPDGVIFSDGDSSPAGIIQSNPLNDSSRCLKASFWDPGIYMLFLPAIEVYSVSTYVLEGPPPELEPEPEPEPGPEPEPEPQPEPAPEPAPEAPEEVVAPEEENSVYLYAFGFDVEAYVLLDSTINTVHAAVSWKELSFSSEVPIAAIQLVGTEDFWLDNIVISTTPAAVPEPATMLLLGCGLLGFAGLRRKFKK